MHNFEIAEWILGLVTSRERAASTVGDLMEQATNRGMPWFWSCVLRTAASLVWRDFADAPGRITALAVLGLVVDGAAGLIFAGLSGVLFLLIAMRGGHPRSIPDSVLFVAPTMLTSLWIGRMLARHAAGREVAVSLAYVMITPVFNLLLMMVWPGGLGFAVLAGMFLADLAERTPALIGAMWGRHRRRAR